MALQVFEDPAQVVAVRCAMGSARLPDLFHDLVFPHGSVLHQLFGGADDRSFVARLDASPLDPAPHCGIGYVPEVPSQKIVHAVYGSQGDVQGIFLCFRGQGALGEQLASEGEAGLGEIEKLDALEMSESPRSGLRVASGSFLHHELRHVELEMMAASLPPCLTWPVGELPRQAGDLVVRPDS